MHYGWVFRCCFELVYYYAAATHSPLVSLIRLIVRDIAKICRCKYCKKLLHFMHHLLLKAIYLFPNAPLLCGWLLLLLLPRLLLFLLLLSIFLAFGCHAWHSFALHISLLFVHCVHSQCGFRKILAISLFSHNQWKRLITYFVFVIFVTSIFRSVPWQIEHFLSCSAPCLSTFCVCLRQWYSYCCCCVAFYYIRASTYSFEYTKAILTNVFHKCKEYFVYISICM